ncbi:DUF3137 domain-containing protein [bacterium]|nr:DUF3137 domain-containing protein [candidate division CSSED10-310 bacterium]
MRRFYDTELKSSLERLEGERRQLRNRYIVTGIIAVVVIGGVYLGVKTFNLPSLIIAAPIIIVAGAAYFLITPILKQFQANFKKGVIEPIVHFIEPGLRYSPDRCVAADTYHWSGLFPHHVDRYRGDDYVTGMLDRTQIEFSELHTEYKTTHRNSKGSQRSDWHTIFRGIFFCADFNKHFRGVTYVLPDTAERALGFIGRKLQEWNKGRGEVVRMEDAEFEKEFAVYGTDQVGARYILSPGLMRRILEFKKKTGKTLYISFAGSRIYVAISIRKPLFEPQTFGSLVKFQPVQEYFEHLTMTIGLVEDLNLNTRIWTKE